MLAPRARSRTLIFVLTLAALLCATAFSPVGSTALAQTRLGGQRFSPATGEDSIFSTEGADGLRPLRPYVSLWIHYTLNPVVLYDTATPAQRQAIVQHVLGGDLVGSVVLWKGLEVGAGIPVNFLGVGPGGLGLSAPGFSLNDITLRVGYRLQIAQDTAIALHVPVLLPTSAASNVLGQGFGVRPTIAFLQRFGQLELLFNLSFLARETNRVLDLTAGMELGARVALRYALAQDWTNGLLAEVGMTTTLGDFFSPAGTPIEIVAGYEQWFLKSWRVTGFIGTGLSHGVGAPDFRAGIGIAYGDNPPYRPRTRGSDQDSDGDGVPDDEDKCPDEKGPRDRNGCPLRIQVEGSRITTFENVQFQTSSDVIVSRSYPMLKDIAEFMRENPDVRVRVEGHSDNMGDEQQNIELSKRRAASVKRYLIQQGVREKQLESEGYGPKRPVASNDTPEGRAKNRRVEFHIVQGG